MIEAPIAIARAILSIPGEILKLKIDHSSSNKKLLEAQQKELEARQELIELQQEQLETP